MADSPRIDERLRESKRISLRFKFRTDFEFIFCHIYYALENFLTNF